MWCVPTWLRCERTGKRCERDNRKVNRLARGNASHDVSWLQIPAHHTTAVRFVERIGHLPPVFQYLFERQRPLPYPIKEFIGIRSDHRIATVRSDKSTVQGVLDSTRLVRFNQNCFFSCSEIALPEGHTVKQAQVFQGFEAHRRDWPTS